VVKIPHDEEREEEMNTETVLIGALFIILIVIIARR